MAINIANYKFYVRDVGITDIDLTNVLTHVINDIAVSTKIFKKAFGFIIEPGIEIYNFNSLLDVYERNQQVTIQDLTINSYTEQQLLDFLNNPENLDLSVTVGQGAGITPNKYLETLDIVTDSIFKDTTGTTTKRLYSLFSNFQYISNNSYKFINYNDPSFATSLPAICLCTVVPDLSNIDDEIETIIKSTIIAGLRYFTDTTQNTQNVNPVNFKYQEYKQAKAELKNTFPTKIGYNSKRVWL